MTLMWLKRFAVCSVTFTGGYITFWSGNTYMRYCKKNEGKSTVCEDISSYIYLPENTGNDFDESVESSWNFKRKNSLPTYWKLFMLCKSKDVKVRHKAVESLSKFSLEKWQYVVIAQASDIDTSIGLARSLNANSHFFLPPPFRDLDEGNLQHELYHILSSLPFYNIGNCAQNLVRQVEKSAGFLFKNGYSLDLEVGDPSVIYHSQQKKKAVFSYDKLCLETILACSSNNSHRNLMMEKGILKILLKLRRSHKKDIEIHSLIAQILANFSLEEKFRNDFYMTGWIGILAEWAKSPFINVNLPATKTLANLDRDDLDYSLYYDGVFILNPQHRLSQGDLSADVIFVHGLLGATFWTWRQCDTQKNTRNDSVVKKRDLNDTASSGKYSMCWPKDWLAADIPSLRIISVDYETCISIWGSCCFQGKEKDSINRRAREMINRLLLSNVGKRPIIWIAHSMGGLIVKKILTEALESKDEKIHALVKETAGIIFYSVPHKGSELANKINSASLILQPSNDITELQKGSPSLLLLHEKFKDFISKCDIPVLSFGETKKSYWGIGLSVLVPLDSADPGFGEFYALPVDHLSTCKPVSSASPEYLKVLKFLLEITSKMSASHTYPLKPNVNIFEISKMLCLIP